jgi:hypothetical protein
MNKKLTDHQTIDNLLTQFNKIDRRYRQDPVVYKTELKSEKDVFYFVEKLYELSSQYHKLNVLIFNGEDQILISVLPAKNSIDGTDVSDGNLSTVRNTLLGLLVNRKSIKVEVGQGVWNRTGDENIR